MANIANILRLGLNMYSCMQWLVALRSACYSYIIYILFNRSRLAIFAPYHAPMSKNVYHTKYKTGADAQMKFVFEKNDTVRHNI